ncbi:MAG: hypothetical protein AAGF12_03655 [Myxococcota bacterium]
MRDLDRYLGGCFFFAMAIIFAGVAVLFAVLVVSPLEMHPVFAVLGCVFVVIIGGAVSVALLIRQKQRNRDERVVDFLSALQAQLGGSLLLSTFLSPFSQPRLRTTFEGAPLEVRLFAIRRTPLSGLIASYAETEHAQLALGGWGWNWQLALYWGRPTPFKFHAVTRTKIATLGAGLMKLREVRTGDAEFDQRFSALTNGPEPLPPSLQELTFAHTLGQLLSVNAPLVGTVVLGPASTWSPGAYFQTPMSDQVTPERVYWVLDRLSWLVNRFTVGEPNYRTAAPRP